MIALWAALALAHPLSPSALTLVESPEGVSLTWRTPARTAVGSAPRWVLPCSEVGPAEVRLDGDALLTEQALDCPDLTGQEIRVEGLTRTDVLLALERRGQTERALLTPSQPSYRVPSAPLPVFPRFLALGVHHLLGGLDHLLLVIGLVWVVRPRGRLVAAVTAFTLGHSASLGLAALGVLALPQAPVEVAIAATLLWLCVEAAEGSQGWISRAPWLVGLGLGLVHGLGFAGALAEAGLPREGLFGALLGFNLGLELAQLGVIAAALLLLRWVPGLGSLRWLASHAAGALAAMWVVERLASMW